MLAIGVQSADFGCRLYGSESGINFSSWFIFAGPNMCISLLLAWFWLVVYFIGPRSYISFIVNKAEVKL